MSFLNPLGLLGLLAALPVIALHILRPRRTEVSVPSTHLWRDFERPVSSSAPWQRLRWSWLLVLQLLAVVVFALALANPARASGSALSKHSVFIIDASASMGARDVDGGRLAATSDRVVALLKDLPPDGTASVVVASDHPEVAISATADRGAVVDAMRRIRPAEAAVDWTSAFTLAQSLEVPGQDIGFVLVSDGQLDEGALAQAPVGTRYERIGSSGANVAISSLRASVRGTGAVAHLSLANFGPDPVTVRVRLDVDEVARATRRVVVDPDQASAVDVPIPAGDQVEARIETPDALAYDNYSVALIERPNVVDIGLIGVENPALTAVFESLPNVEIVDVKDALSTDADLLVFNEADPPAGLKVPSLVFAAPNGAPGVAVSGSVDTPAIALVEVDDPLLSGLDLSDVAIGVAQQIDVPTADVLVAAEGAPLVVRTQTDSASVYVAWRLPDSNFYVQVAFPLFIDRVLTELVRSTESPAALTAGAVLPIDAGRGGSLDGPLGKSELSPGDAPPVAEAVGVWTFLAPEAKTPNRFAVNPVPEESRIEPVPALAIPERTRAFDSKPAPALKSMRPLFIWVLIALILVEFILARRRVGVSRRQWRSATVVRGVAIGLAILAAIGLSVPRGSDRMATMFLVDGSASIGAGGRSEELDWVGEALGDQPDDALAGVAVFGADARLESTVRKDLQLDELTTEVDPSRTNVASALRLAGAVLPTDAKRRVVLLGDGRQTDGDMRAEAERLRRQGIVVELAPTARDTGEDAAVQTVDAPSTAAAGDTVRVQSTVYSTIAGPATITLLLADREVDRRQVTLAKGANNVTFDAVIPAGIDLARFGVRVTAPGDQVAENDNGYAAVQVSGAKKILVIEGEPDNAHVFVAALRASGLVVETTAPSAVTDAESLGAYESIVLADVAVSDFNDAQMASITSATRDLGRGLVVLGGKRSYALGGYRDTKMEEILPVISDVLDPKRRVKVSEVLAIDTSGSMGACHCGANGNGMNSGGGGAGLNEGGVNKTDIARSAASRSVDALAPSDEVGILGIDNDSEWLVNLTSLSSGEDSVRNAIDNLRHTSAGTDLSESLDTAYEQLKASKAGVKHIVLFTDGFTGDSVLREVADDAAELRKKGVTVSVLSTGETSSVALLEAIATSGGGRFYAGTNLRAIPQIMAQETIIASRSFINEGSFLPEITSNARVVADLKAAPELLGYVATTAKPTATVLMRIGDERDPLLATWQNGLGRSTAWTSDISDRWSARWANWDGYVGFWSAVVRDSMPSGSDDVQLSTRVVGDELRITLEGTKSFADGTSAKARVSGPGVDGTEVALERTAENTFSAKVPAAAAGSYQVGTTLTRPQGAPIISTSVANRFYPAEFKPGAVDPDALVRLSKITGGRGAIEPAMAFDAADLRSGTVRAPFAGWLLLASLVLWLLMLVLGRVALRADPINDQRHRAAGRIRAALRSPRDVIDGATAPRGATRGSRRGVDGGASPRSAPTAGAPTSSAQSVPVEGATTDPEPEPRSSGTVGALLDAKRKRRSGGNE